MTFISFRATTDVRTLFRIFCLASFSLMTACASSSYGPYTVRDNPIGETRDWKIALFQEPGQLSINMRLAYSSSATISLNGASENGPLKVILSNSDCGAGHEVGIQYFTNHTESQFKYFKTLASSEETSNIAIDWDKDGQFSVSLNGETLKVKAEPTIYMAHIRSSDGTINIQNLQYTKKSSPQ